MAGLNFDFREMNARRRQTRRPRNVHDKTSVISILPKELHKEFITLEHSNYTIPAGSVEKPAILILEGTSWWSAAQPAPAPMLEVQVDSFSLATSLLRDTLIGMLECKIGEAQPGIFIIPGVVTLTDLKTKYSEEVKRAENMQKRWFEALVTMANIDWPRSQGNPLAIHDDSRLAANELGRKDLPWMGQFTVQELIPCVACGAPRNPKYPVCGSCHNVIDSKLAESLNIKVG